MDNKKSVLIKDLDDTNEKLKRKKTQKRQLKESEQDTVFDEMLEDTEDDNLYYLLKKIK
jgi:hypothetical protein